MAKAIVTKQVLDELIRAKLRDQGACSGVKPLPVTWRQRASDGCNWVIPGWTGESSAVLNCTEQMRRYLQDLRLQFDLPEEA